MIEMQKIINEIRSQVDTGNLTGLIIVDGEYTTQSEETIYGSYHIKFELTADNHLDFGSRITFHNEEGGFDVSESAEEILDAGFNFWIESVELSGK